MRVVDNLYKSNEDLQTQIAAFAKEFAPKALHRLALKDLKMNMHSLTYENLNNCTMTCLEIMYAKPFNMGMLKPPKL
jgi:hypothetical protein